MLCGKFSCLYSSLWVTRGLFWSNFGLGKDCSNIMFRFFYQFLLLALRKGWERFWGMELVIYCVKHRWLWALHVWLRQHWAALHLYAAFQSKEIFLVNDFSVCFIKEELVDGQIYRVRWINWIRGTGINIALLAVYYISVGASFSIQFCTFLVGHFEWFLFQTSSNWT